jgi:hypothetical protein
LHRSDPSTGFPCFPPRVRCRHAPVLPAYVVDSHLINTGARTALSPRCEKTPDLFNFSQEIKVCLTPKPALTFLPRNQTDYKSQDLTVGHASDGMAESQSHPLENYQGKTPDPFSSSRASAVNLPARGERMAMLSVRKAMLRALNLISPK